MDKKPTTSRPNPNPPVVLKKGKASVKFKENKVIPVRLDDQSDVDDCQKAVDKGKKAEFQRPDGTPILMNMTGCMGPGN